MNRLIVPPCVKCGSAKVNPQFKTCSNGPIDVCAIPDEPRSAFDSKGHTEPHVCFCGPCSTRIVELEAEVSRLASLKQKLVDANYDLQQEVEALHRSLEQHGTTVLESVSLQAEVERLTGLLSDSNLSTLYTKLETAQDGNAAKQAVIDRLEAQLRDERAVTAILTATNASSKSTQVWMDLESQYLNLYERHRDLCEKHNAILRKL